MSVCQRCGVELLPNKAPGRPRKWCSERCRKSGGGDPCVDCGKRTSYVAASRRVETPRCRACAGAARTVWSSESIIAAIRSWANEYGEPPALVDWNPHAARVVLHDEERAQRFEAADGRWPSKQAVVNVFGSWNRAIAAAGFSTRAPVGDLANTQRKRQMRAVSA